MTPERWRRVEGVFRDALVQSPQARDAFLRSVCRNDSDLRREVLSLLASHEEAGSFLDEPLLDAGAFEDAVGAEPARTFLPGQMVAERFRIVRFLAEGGMGEVYEALDTERGEPVALKTIHQTLADDEEAEARFERESQLARKVVHPNVCRTYGFFSHLVRSGNYEGRIRCLSMELLSGETLARRLRRGGPLPVARARPIARQIAEALKAAHDVDVVHRDLKPDNVILVPSKEGIRAIVTDFGLARDDRALDFVPPSARLDLLWMLHGLQAGPPVSRGALTRLAKKVRRPMVALGLVPPEARLTEIGRIMGTPAYMSPEQARGERGDQRSDIWSFGIVFYEMLTGRLPYRPESEWSRFLRKLLRRERRPARLGLRAPRAVKRAIFRCLEIEAAKRYDSLDALLAELPD